MESKKKLIQTTGKWVLIMQSICRTKKGERND